MSDWDVMSRRPAYICQWSQHNSPEHSEHWPFSNTTAGLENSRKLSIWYGTWRWLILITTAHQLSLHRLNADHTFISCSFSIFILTLHFTYEVPQIIKQDKMDWTLPDKLTTVKKSDTFKCCVFWINVEISVGLRTTRWKPAFSDDCRYKGNKHTKWDSGMLQCSQIKLMEIPMQ